MVEVKTNHHWHDFIAGYELPEGTREKEFDYLTEEDFNYRSFAIYKGEVIDAHEFANTSEIGKDLEELRKWHGYRSDSFFSGVVIRYSSDCEQYQIGTFIA